MKALKSYVIPESENKGGSDPVQSLRAIGSTANLSRKDEGRPPRLSSAGKAPAGTGSHITATTTTATSHRSSSWLGQPVAAAVNRPKPLLYFCPAKASSPSAHGPSVVASSHFESGSGSTPSLAQAPPSHVSVSGSVEASANPNRLSSKPPSTRASMCGSIRPSSLRHALFPTGDERNTGGEALREIRNDIMVNWLYEQQLRLRYVSGEDPFEGVVLKKGRGSFTCYPRQMAGIPGSLYGIAIQMNVRCAMTVNTHLVRALVESFASQEPVGHVPLPDGLRVQIIPTLADLPRAKLHHFAAFIQDVRMLVVWDDEPEKLLQRAHSLEMRCVEMIWGTGVAGDAASDEKKQARMAVEDLDPLQLEEARVREHRPVRLESAFMVALTLALMISCLGFGLQKLVLEIMVDGDYTRLALCAVFPVQAFVSLFFFQSIIGNLMQIFGPISAVANNSKCYSGRAPRRLNPLVQALPHVTIQMPVYKEGLAAVIKPTVMSLKAAISTYEMQGGTANIFVNDDGMQLMSDEDAQARRDFYDEHSIGWVARPRHCPRPEAEKGERLFLRRGKFKKASNMNYALHVSNRVEEKLAVMMRGPQWDDEHELAAYFHCLEEVLQENEGRTWAEGNIRVGDYILIIDSDTRVPHDCLLDAASEMEQSPEVAIIQFTSGVMNVTSSYFENGVTWFTRLIYTAIKFAVASGDACPFVGHNAVLRWSAMQHAAAYEDEDGYEKYWSESHVSEDFDMALRLQVTGYSLRYAAYTGEGFKEGVSLTVYDELARWEKYAYGCNELLFHPLRFWLLRGPFTPLFKKFVFSSIPLPKKLTMCAYIGTYYAIAAAWALTLANYFITGWFYGLYDKLYLDSFAIYVSIVAVFTGLGNISLAAVRYRMGDQPLMSALIDNMKWIPLFTVFLGGISVHLSQAILCHFFEIDMVWGATAKELDKVNFGQEIVRILRRFKWTFAFCAACTALITAGYHFFPHEWQIRTFFSIYPLCSIIVGHFMLPVLLNPALMMFTY